MHRNVLELDKRLRRALWRNRIQERAALVGLTGLVLLLGTEPDRHPYGIGGVEVAICNVGDESSPICAWISFDVERLQSAKVF